jgi:hypothetical protein
MKKILFFSILLCFILCYADTIDFNNWTVKIESKDTNGSPTQIADQAKVLIKNALFDANRTIEDYLAANGRMSKQFSRTNLSIKQSDYRYLSDGSTIYIYEIPITGQLLKMLVPGTGGGIPIATLCCPTCHQLWPENMPIPDGVKLIPVENELTPEYTGVLIDARDITLNPALFLKVFTEEGKEAYGLSFADSIYVVNEGLVSYVHSLDQAFSNERLGFNPLRITALKSSGLNKTDIIISDASAKMMHSSQQNLKNLEQCKVVILLSE